MIGFIAGFLIGGAVGIIVSAMMTVASEEDDSMFDDEWI